MPPEKITLAEKFDLFDDRWTPKIVGSFDDYDVKIVKLEGDFVWHDHADEDELFLVLEGRMTIAFRDGDVVLEAGDMIVVPKGVEHKPSADKECRVLVIERQGVINTGRVDNHLTVSEPERL